MRDINQALGKVLAKYRLAAKISQEELADRAGIHRTYVSQIERGLKSPTLAILLEISRALDFTASRFIGEVEKEINCLELPYKINSNFQINCGFDVNSQQILTAINQTNNVLSNLPATLYKSIDYKTISSIVGSIFCEYLASIVGAIVNPIEKGHPDIIPQEGSNSSEELLRNYPLGLEVKCTVGNISKGANLRAGQTRVKYLTGITWQAHHQEVQNLLGLIWDFVSNPYKFNYPKITMGQGWILMLDDQEYINKYQKLLKFKVR